LSFELASAHSEWQKDDFKSRKIVVEVLNEILDENYSFKTIDDLIAIIN
jgi:hypothetical protein